jgi:hypothetical protein
VQLDKDKLKGMIEATSAPQAGGEKKPTESPREKAKQKAKTAIEEGKYFRAFEIYNELGMQHEKEDALRLIIQNKTVLSEFQVNKVKFYGRENLSVELMKEFIAIYETKKESAP